MFWLSYECFSILCNAFLLKSAISSHNSCVQSHIFQYISNVFHDLHQQCLPCLWESKKFSGNGISLNFPNRKFIWMKKPFFQVSNFFKFQTFFDNSCHNINICILFNYFNVSAFKKAVEIFVFSSTRFEFFIIMFIFTFHFMNYFCKIIKKIWR